MAEKPLNRFYGLTPKKKSMILSLSSTGYKAVDVKRIDELAKLRQHFELLSPDIDEVDLVEPRYYRKTTKSMQFVAWSIIIVVGLYFGWKLAGVVT